MNLFFPTVAAFALAVFACVVATPASSADGPAAPAASEWTSLFDGTETSAKAHFIAYGKDQFPEKGWSVNTDGTLQVHAGQRGGDIATRETYGDFELELEWKVANGANSGIFYRAPDIAGKPIYWNAFECQVLDNARHPDGKLPSHRAGSLYDIYECSDGDKAYKPAGEWNKVVIHAEGDHITHTLNGTVVVDCTLTSDDYKARFAKSKFHDWAGFGTHASGRLGLQDHGDDVWFRNIKVKVISGKK